MVFAPALGLAGLVATGSDSLENELISDSLESGMSVPDGSIDTLQGGEVASLLLLIIFALGIIAGLIAGSIMWREVK